MCGRYASMRDTADLILLTGAEDETADEAASDRVVTDPAVDPVRSANVAPTDRARVLLEVDGHLVLRRHVWGLIPPWSKGPEGAARMVNARVETVAEKPSYRRAVRTARCLLPADGWYEWQAGPDGKQPHFVQRRDSRPLWLAGIWARWHPPGGGPVISSAAVLTQPAPAELEWLHERAPVVVADAFIPQWLAADGQDPTAVLDTVRSLGYPPLQWHAVSKEVGQVRVKGPHLLNPVAPHPVAAALF